jgi:hypothetical protein
MERQAHGAPEALDELLREQTLDGDPEAAYKAWRSVRWRDADEAEMALLRFLRDFAV